jgi:glyoxylase-like metal-dependent hydrolase (beta-lactamase superfamily II)
VHGRDRDLLIDTGLGHFSLPDHVALVSERPLVCVASPTHFDHIGCHHELGERCVHFAEAAILADPRNEWTLADRYATDEMFDRFPEGWSAERYRIWLAPASVPSPIATWSFSSISVSRSTRPDTAGRYRPVRASDG